MDGEGVYEAPDFCHTTKTVVKVEKARNFKCLFAVLYIMISLCLAASMAALAVGLIPLQQQRSTIKHLETEVERLDDVMHSTHTPAAQTVAEEKMKCPPSYKYNPFSNTCLRIVNIKKTWSDAKRFCEANGEYLATFGSLESAYWFITLRSTDPEWQEYMVWIGGERSSTGEWMWDGLLQEPISITVWGEEQPYDIDDYEDCPDGACKCMASNQMRYYLFIDFPCSSQRTFICERTD